MQQFLSFFFFFFPLPLLYYFSYSWYPYLCLVVWDSVTCIIVKRVLPRRAYPKRKEKNRKYRRERNLARGGEHAPFPARAPYKLRSAHTP